MSSKSRKDKEINPLYLNHAKEGQGIHFSVVPSVLEALTKLFHPQDVPHLAKYFQLQHVLMQEESDYEEVRGWSYR